MTLLFAMDFFLTLTWTKFKTKAKEKTLKLLVVVFLSQGNSLTNRRVETIFEASSDFFEHLGQSLV